MLFVGHKKIVKLYIRKVYKVHPYPVSLGGELIFNKSTRWRCSIDTTLRAVVRCYDAAILDRPINTYTSEQVAAGFLDKRRNIVNIVNTFIHRFIIYVEYKNLLCVVSNSNKSSNNMRNDVAYVYL